MRFFRRSREPSGAARGSTDPPTRDTPSSRQTPSAAPPGVAATSVWARAAADAATVHARLTALVPQPLPPGPLGGLLGHAVDVSGRALDQARAMATAGAARWPDRDLATPADPVGRAAHDRLRSLVGAHRDLGHRVGLLTVGVAETERRFLLAGVRRAADTLDALVAGAPDDRCAAAFEPGPPTDGKDRGKIGGQTP